MRQLFLDNLPKFNKNIDWKACIGLDIKFIYNNIEGVLKVINIKKDENKKIKIFTIEYKNNTFEMCYNNFIQCKISSIITNNISKTEYNECIKDWEENSNENKKMFLENLPVKHSFGSIRIDWNRSVGYEVYFIYNKIKGKLKILNYKDKLHLLTVGYNDDKFDITTASFSNCQLDRYFGNRNYDFQFEVGKRIIDKKRDITIIDRKRIKGKGRCYKYICNKCKYDCSKHYNNVTKTFEQEYWISESKLLEGNGCICCSGTITVEHINSIVATTPWMIDYFQGGYDEAKKYTKSSNQKIYFKCPDCGRIKRNKKTIDSLYKDYSINCSCSDNIPYGEKTMYIILEQLRLDFKTQLSKLNFKWCKNYRYDFYFELNNEKYIVETHGMQHYKDAWDKLEKTQLNDKSKKELALQNVVKPENYIVIDCRKSESEWIRKNILNSKLNKLFDLSKIDWNKCHKFACKTRIKEACEIKRRNPNMTTEDISKIMKISSTTIRDYLKKGNLIWDWCNYNPKEEAKKNGKNNGKSLGQDVIVLKNNIYITIAYSASELSRISDKTLNVKLVQSCISKACRMRTEYKGYTLKYIRDLTLEEYIKYDIENKLKELHNKDLGQAC